MLQNKLPRVTWLRTTNLDPRFKHGIAISVLRGLAALEVVAAHVRAQLYPGLKGMADPALAYQVLAFFTGFAHQAVVVFFVLSGWLVGGSLLNKLHQPGSLASYAIDRVTRLWIVLVPACLLTLALAIADGSVDPRRPDLLGQQAFSGAAFLGNLAGVQDMLVPRYGGNFALWSLAYESWYYVLFPLLVLVLGARRPAAKMLAGLALVALLLVLNTPIVLYFSVWLLGAFCSRIRIRIAAAGLALLVTLLAALSTWFRLAGSNDILVEESFIQDLVFGAVFLLVLCCLQSPADMRRPALRFLALWGERLAAFSFTLYVIHVPLLLAIRRHLAPMLPEGRLDPDRAAHYALYAAVTLAIVLMAWLFHLPFEAQTPRLRRWIKRLRTSRKRRETVAA